MGTEKKFVSSFSKGPIGVCYGLRLFCSSFTSIKRNYIAIKKADTSYPVVRDIYLSVHYPLKLLDLIEAYHHNFTWLENIRALDLANLLSDSHLVHIVFGYVALELTSSRPSKDLNGNALARNLALSRRYFRHYLRP